MTTQDLITFKPKISQLITDLETVEMLREENIDCLLRYFRKGAMTIRELTDEFKKEGQIKSESSVYRYVQKMIQAKVAAKAGKRITSINEEEIRSETLYSRTARVFLIVDTFENIDKILGETSEQILQLIRKLLQLNYENKTINTKNFEKLLNQLIVLRFGTLSDLLDKADESTLELFNNLEFTTIQNILELVGWLSIIEKSEFQKLFNESFNSKRN